MPASSTKTQMPSTSVSLHRKPCGQIGKPGPQRLSRGFSQPIAKVANAAANSKYL